MKRFLAILAVLLAPAAGWAQVPPNADWRTIQTEHFRVTFPSGLEALAAHAADRAEAAHARLAAGLASAPGGTIDILLTDFVDVSNGSATPFPSNRIVLFARPPVDEPSLAYFDDWIDLVVTHELAHIFHLDATSGLGSVLRHVFGRLPSAWPLFPAVATPKWSIEGLATYIESDYTGTGRVHGTYHDMVLRTAALEDEIESLDRVTGSGPRWPGGSRVYIYGSLFADYLAERYGPEVHEALVDATAHAWIPPFLSFDRLAKKATGRSFTQAYGDWRSELEARYARLADSLRAEGLTEAERLTDAGYAVEHPRVGPAGRVAYAASDGRSTAATRILEPGSGRIRNLARRNGLDAVAWLPDGSILTAQLETDGPYRLYGDLFRIGPDGTEQRLTHGARLTEPDATRDGRRVVAVQGISGTNRLVVFNLESRELLPLTGAAVDVHWVFPRWAPNGDRIAVARWQRGMYDVVVLDAHGRVLRELSHDRAIDTAPAWSADGRYVVFASDRSGIPNLYAYDLAEGTRETDRLRQVTNLLTGAFYPDASPDGRWIYFAGYHADGYHVERVPFDPATWREPAPVRAEFRVASLAAPAPSGAAPTGAPTGEAEEAGSYSPWPTLLPRAWLPTVYSENGAFYGASIAGSDLVGRHGYALTAAYNVEKRLLDGRLYYAYAGLGNPVLGLDLWRSWERVALAAPSDAPLASLMTRDDGIELSATLRRRRYRSDAYVNVGGERVVESWHLFDAPGYGVSYPGTTFNGVVVRAGYANYQRFPFSISRQDGVSLAMAARRRWDRDPFITDQSQVIDRSYDDVSAVGTAYRGVRVFGFADHVLALRVAGRARTGPGADPFDIGGASAAGASFLGQGFGGANRFLPVRGFSKGDRFGTRGWAASVEYRLPLALIDRGYKLWPAYLDRLSAALFADTGDAWCTDAERTDFTTCPAAGAAPLVGAGAELGLDLSLFFGPRFRLRVGAAQPLRGGPPGAGPVAYVRVGPSY